MKNSFIFVLIILFVSLIISSVIITYSTISHYQKLYESELNYIQELSNQNPDIIKRITIFKALSKNRTIKTTRSLIFLLFINIFIILIVFILYIYFIQKPIFYLYNSINKIKKNKPEEFKPIVEKGSNEIKTLINSFNELMIKIQNYSKLMGDINKYQGWKQISRIIVHEINNLISPIQTYSEFLLEVLTENFYKEKIQFILLKLNEIKLVLQKFHSISHLPDPVFEKVNVINLIREIVSEFLSVSLISDYNEIIINTDSVLFKEILRNIIKNAFEAGENIKVCISVNKVNENVEIKIIDNGPGIPNEIISKIFEPGFSTKKGNIGIGLSLSKSLVEELNGNINVYSEIGTGTCFTLNFKTI